MPIRRETRYAASIEERRHIVHNGDGWLLDVRGYVDPDRLDVARRPVLMIPGYCMNTSPLIHHPTGPSLVSFLVADGFEVWTANLRGQGDTKSIGGRRNVGFEALVLTDLAAAIDAVLAGKRSTADRVDIIGCSLGGTFVYAYLAHHSRHRVGAVVGMGAPLRWARLNPLVKMAFRSPRLAGMIRVSKTRATARLLLPVAKRFRPVMSVYMNVDHVDLSNPEPILQTVEDPIPQLNREIAQWLANKDLVVGGIDVTAAMRRVDRPILSVYANRDGIVPPHAAESIQGVAPNVELCAVGDDETWYAHADLFIGRTADHRVFTPVRDWLRRQD